MRNDKENLIVKLTFEFALEIIGFSEEIRKSNRFEMASQIFRSGTSIGANIREAQNAESKADFIHKFKISAKETDELHFWLELCKSSEF
jgi:four helix bundle protein